MNTIHPTAVVSKEAGLAPGVEIGPYAIIGPHVKIGAGTRVMSHAVIDGHTKIGERCLIYPGACLGMPAQDKKFKGGIAYLEVGNDNVIREHVTMHAGNQPEATTRVGDRNYFMAGSHVGHDSQVGNDITMANSAALGGFTVVEDFAMIGGLVGVHQHCRVGRYAMVGAGGKVASDIAPYSLSNGNPQLFYGVNSVGLKRAGYASKDILIIKKALVTLLGSQAALSTAAAKIEKEFPGHPDVRRILDFIKHSKRGVARAVREE